MTLASISSSGAAGDGISLTDVTGGTLSITGSTSIEASGGNAIDIEGTNSAAFSFGDMDIALNGNSITALDLGGATLDGNVTADDFDVSAGQFADLTGIDLKGTTGSGTIQIGDTTPGDGNGATIGTGIAIGIDFAGDTNVIFTFGDGEGDQAGDIDQASRIDSVIQINAATPPTNGTYNFRDVDFQAGGRDINNVFPAAGDAVIFVGSAATGDGTGSNLDNSGQYRDGGCQHGCNGDFRAGQ